jgi:ribosomal protein S7
METNPTLRRRKKESATKVLLRRRNSDKERQRRYRERQLDDGKKSVTVFISSEAHTILIEAKDRTGESNSEIIEQAILNLKTKPKLKRRKTK